MPKPKSTSQIFVAVLAVLQEYNLLDDTGHIPGCVYREDSPTCTCTQFGSEIYAALSQKSQAV